MPNPSQKLYRLLAESWHYQSQIQASHQQVTDRIPQQTDQLYRELDQLRAYLQQVGVGVDLDAEDRYLGILVDLRQMGQIYGHGRRISPIPKMNQELSKALDYGRLLLDVYGTDLSKSASAMIPEVKKHIRLLNQYQDPDAQTLKRKLEGSLAD